MSTDDRSHATPSPPRKPFASSRSAVGPIVLVVIGVLILLGQFGIMPELTTLWTVGLAACGILTFVFNGFNKSTLVVGSFLIVAAVLSVLRTNDVLEIKNEVPIVFIVLGALMLVARSATIPAAPSRSDDG
tara:strand:- start:415 stop:807 length:393 start_codon:yes stop_codon:yes gene_type:complete